ncbi:MAG: HyaD/HybD family hydrogenase maturation endopeptidase [Desulfofustis sp. PB-SRB1]|jgi:hydrogenase maturation protease|nr:HyaD/HybD family hydrogenase maturation endopeptidase [Desulfofustis sp. PB-SRB1]MBM1001028.1 HyaD/HybD family hydrogenase maturation endopeptidase [Desulfofustis sp. PB-SRB1]HBH27689.1 hydrogenase maturation endopeptidase [Desulfofustis sp.]HBH32576.1 hydrogenase maturation endopeptidase [Desulfofustis sp.]
MEKKIGVLGVGNLIVGDEGFGLHTIYYLQNHYRFPDHVELMDGGTAGLYLSPFLEECDPVLVVDVVDIDAEPGSMHYFSNEDVKAGRFSTRMSPHQLGLLEILEICKLRDAAPAVMEFYCVVPHTLETTTELSAVVAPRVKEMAEIILKRLSDFGVTPEPLS